MYIPQSTTDLTSKILSIFSDIENDIPNGVGGLYERRLEVGSCVPIYFGIENPANLLQISVVIPRVFYHLISLDKREGFALSISGEKSSGTSFKLCIHLLDKRFYELFLVLLQDLVETIIRQSEVKPAVENFIGRIEHWKKFLKKSAKRVLSYEEQIGLAGELCMLKNLIKIHGHNSALNSWKGPLGAAQDFVCSGALVEVKSSTIKHENEIKISSEYQLASEGNDNIYLYHCVFNVNDELTSDSTLPYLVDEISRELTQELNVKFYGLLKCVGYFPDDEDLYKSNMFKLIKTSFYFVSADFPKLVSNKLPKPIFHVTYRISTDTLNGFLVDMNEVITRES
jgi:hypothetical protein